MLVRRRYVRLSELCAPEILPRPSFPLQTRSVLGFLLLLLLLLLLCARPPSSAFFRHRRFQATNPCLSLFSPSRSLRALRALRALPSPSHPLSPSTYKQIHHCTIITPSHPLTSMSAIDPVSFPDPEQDSSTIRLDEAFGMRRVELSSGFFADVLIPFQTLEAEQRVQSVCITPSTGYDPTIPHHISNRAVALSLIHSCSWYVNAMSSRCYNIDVNDTMKSSSA